MTSPRPAVGEIAPDFTLPGDDGAAFTLSSARGQKVVIYFYPKDDTPTCTQENKDFSALAAEFAAAKTLLIGVSKDTVAKHGKFRAKHDLAPLLLSDADSTLCEDWGIWVEKKLYGREYMGIERATFLIGPEGTIAARWDNVKTKGHAEAVLAAAQAL